MCTSCYLCCNQKDCHYYIMSIFTRLLWLETLFLSNTEELALLQQQKYSKSSKQCQSTKPTWPEQNLHRDHISSSTQVYCTFDEDTDHAKLKTSVIWFPILSWPWTYCRHGNRPVSLTLWLLLVFLALSSQIQGLLHSIPRRVPGDTVPPDSSVTCHVQSLNGSSLRDSMAALRGGTDSGVVRCGFLGSAVAN